MTIFNVTTASGAIILTAEGDVVNVMAGASVSNSAVSGKAIANPSLPSGPFGGSVINNGIIFGAYSGIEIGRIGTYTDIFNGSQGSVIGAAAGYGMSLTGSLSVLNYGQIYCAGISGYALNITSGSSGSIVNYGAIGAPSGFNGVGLKLAGTSAMVFNYGSISALRAIDSSDTQGDYIVNYGRISGTVQLSAAFSTFNSSQGAVEGSITAGAGGAIIAAGFTGGAALGSTGNDVLYANPTQTAADNTAQTLLDGAGGNNALYGGGAYTTFVGGTAAGGTNQIWGGASLMTQAVGYTNNSISFATSARGVYVDLLTGHNAYVSTATNWTGSGVFEDAIAAAGFGLSTVPNVVGSAQSDLIIADNGVDRIAGGGKADQLYAGTGASSQDTFIYSSAADSSLSTGYDTIVGFKLGVDKIDVSNFMQANGLAPNSVAIFSNGTSNTVYVQKTPGVLNAATDLALIVNTSSAGGLNAARDFIL